MVVKRQQETFAPVTLGHIRSHGCAAHAPAGNRLAASVCANLGDDLSMFLVIEPQRKTSP